MAQRCTARPTGPWSWTEAAGLRGADSEALTLEPQISLNWYLKPGW